MLRFISDLFVSFISDNLNVVFPSPRVHLKCSLPSGSVRKWSEAKKWGLFRSHAAFRHSRPSKDIIHTDEKPRCTLGSSR